MAVTLNTKILLRRGTKAEFQSVVLSSGEPAYLTDVKQLRIGDGITACGNLTTALVAGNSVASAYNPIVSSDELHIVPTVGARSVDLQTSRENENFTVSGTDSFAAGSKNSCSGNYSIILGTENHSTADYSILIGANNVATDIDNVCSVVLGYGCNASSGIAIGWGAEAKQYGIALGNHCSAGEYSLATGSYADTSNYYGCFGLSGGVFTKAGDSQITKFILYRKTLDEIQVKLGDGALGGPSRIFTNKPGSFSLDIVVVCNSGDGSIYGKFRRSALVQFDGTTVTTIENAVTGTDIKSNPLLDVTFSASVDTNTLYLDILVTGLNSTTLYWVASVDMLQFLF